MIEILRENIDEIRELRMSGVKIKDLAKKYNVTYPSMAHFLTTNRIVLNPTPINEEVIFDIVESYKNGEAYDALSRKHHMDKETVRNIIISNGLEIKDKSHAFQKYTIDETYFDSIDTPNKAYIFGLITTDGSVSSNPNHYHMRINLQERDENILKLIQQEMNINRPLFHYISDNPSYQDQYILLVDNKHLVTKLRELGIDPNKTETAKFPNFIDDSLMSHFIRGCWDGDGTIGKFGRHYRAEFIGTEHLVSGIKMYVENKLDVHFSYRDAYCEMSGIKTISIGGRIQVNKFLDFLYHDADLYIDRKYQRYCNMFQISDRSVAV